MTSATRTSRRGLVWAVAGGAVLLVGIVAVIVASLLARPAPEPQPISPAATAQPTPTEDPPPLSDAVVDASVSENGWIAEPITTDADTYARAALAAASSFDTTKASREDWLAYLDSWFTLDTRYTTDADQQEVLQSSRLELRQGVVLPETEWDFLAASDGRVLASTTGDVLLADVPNDASGDMTIATADVLLTFTQDDGTGEETKFEESVRVSVQVLCGPASIPTPGSAQRAGDCKVIRYFTEPLEP